MRSTTRRSVAARTIAAVAALSLTACSPAQPVATPGSSGTAAATLTPSSLAPTAVPATPGQTELPRNPAAYVEGAPFAPAIDPAGFVEGVDNPFFPMEVGARFVFDGDEHVEVEVLADTKIIMGITATVVRDRVFEDCEVIEDTLDWYGQDAQGNVWYLGEETAEYENGEITSTAGSWEAGVDGALPGIVMLADPQAGDIYRQEFYAGEAEDLGEVTAVTGSVSAPAGDWSGSDVLVTEEWTPLEPDVRERKIYARGFGVVRIKTIEGGNELDDADQRRAPEPLRRYARGRLPRRLSPCTLSTFRGERQSGARAKMPRIVRGALLQASWTGDKESMIQKHEAAAHEAAKQGAQVMLFQELFYGPYFCQVQDAKYYAYTELIPDGPTTKRMQDLAKQTGMVLVVPMYEEDAQASGIYYNTAAVIDADGHVPRQVPQDPHPARQGLLGEVLLPARQHGLPGLRDRGRQGRRVHLLRPPLPRGRARARASTAPRWCSSRRATSRGLSRIPVADRAGQPRRRQRLLRRDDQPGRASSPRSATTTSTARATSSTRAASSSATVGIAARRGADRPGHGPRHDPRGPPDLAVLPGPPTGRVRDLTALGRYHPSGSAVGGGRPSRFVGEAAMQFGFTLKPEHTIERDARPRATRPRRPASTTAGCSTSHVLWRDPYPLLTLMARRTPRSCASGRA